jgi:ABC-type branched-subunit amino acid transport system ATPase component
MTDVAPPAPPAPPVDDVGAAATSAALLHAHDVTVRFGGVVALDSVSLTVPERSVVGLVGPNGAGKTTMFGVLSGLVQPRTGRIELAGVDVTRASPQRRARLGLARTFQRLELFGELTVREHFVVAHRVHHGRDRQFWRDLVGLGSKPTPGEDGAVDELLDLLGLRDVADRPVILLPLGTGRLVEVGRALAAEPRIVLLDEPTSGLGSHETEQLSTTLRAVRDERDVAIVLVEHDVELVLSLADAVTVLDFGKVIADGPPELIRTDAKVQAAYLGGGPETGA